MKKTDAGGLVGRVSGDALSVSLMASLLDVRRLSAIVFLASPRVFRWMTSLFWYN
jgi:hypothetical protein